MGEYLRFMARCVTCSNLWSVAPTSLDERCPCGGELAQVDTRVEAEKLPYFPMKSEPPKEK